MVTAINVMIPTSSWHSYPKVYNLGHRAIKNLFDDPVIIEEKLDGSQFSFGRFGNELRMKSKGAIINPETVDKLFVPAVNTVGLLKEQLKDGWTYRGEVISKPKHNTLKYERTPNGCIAIFDINRGEEDYLSYTEKQAHATDLGLETVPLLYYGTVDISTIHNLMETTSFLGGVKIEGVVIKNYNQFGPDGKVQMGKHVSENFKEMHFTSWTAANPGKGDVVQNLINSIKTKARWEKAVQHVRERGELEEDPRDIGKLIKEVHVDIMEECPDMIKEALFSWAKGHIIRGSTAGLPEWYKNKLMEKQFEQH